MTPSLIKTEHQGIQITTITKATRESDGGVSIDLGGQWRIYGNRREDFENLIAAAQRALELFPPNA